ncbi:unnamed protein product [Rhizophagus irregularis]|uniref:Uncharacterized protein n=1 Tax=Rhizophagus irregularis TaxID=588596 RepID=A0A916DZT4_9GLOM|nr:unnamed protein product [Rhizophagus irregularis]
MTTIFVFDFHIAPKNLNVSHKLDDDGEGVDGGVRSIGIVLISYLFINYNHMFTVTEYSKQRSELRFYLDVIIGLFIVKVKVPSSFHVSLITEKSLKYSNISFREWIFTER